MIKILHILNISNRLEYIIMVNNISKRIDAISPAHSSNTVVFTNRS